MLWGLLGRTPRSRGSQRERRVLRSRLGLLTFAVALLIGLLVPLGASAATLAQARQQLLSRNLQPPPLFPTRLPPTFRGANVVLDGWSGVDYSVGFTIADCEGYRGCVSVLRGSSDGFARILHKPYAVIRRRMRIGRRDVYAGEGGAADPDFLTWVEQGRTYVVVAKLQSPLPAGVSQLSQALKVLVPLVQDLEPLRAPATSCKALTFISVRGSGETSTGSADMAASPVTRRVYQAMVSRLPAGTPQPGFYQVPYPALSVSVLVAGLQTGSIRAREDRFFANLTTYISGEKQGEANLASYISDTEQTCPNARFALVGYSQGAMAVHDYLALLAQSGSAAERGAIRGAVLVADPERTPNSRVDNFGTARSDGYGVCHASETIFHVAVCVSGPATKDVPRFVPNVWQVCDDGDIVCDTSVLLHLNTLNGWKDQLKGGELTHTSYCFSGPRATSCELSLTTAGQALGRRLSARSARDVNVAGAARRALSARR
jgi:cutinase